MDEDKIFRFGGDEFIIITNYVSLEGIKRIHKQMNQDLIDNSPSGSASFGVVVLSPSELKENFHIEEVYKKIDEHLYKNKRRKKS